MSFGNAKTTTEQKANTGSKDVTMALEPTAKIDAPKKLLPLAVENFGRIREQNYLYCDKTHGLIEWLSKGEVVTLWTRPRRWGKTLFLSTIQHFCAPTVEGRETKPLFEGLAIAKRPDLIAAHQGKYPVIFITFKDVRENSLEENVKKVGVLMQKLYIQYNELERSERLSSAEKAVFNKYATNQANQQELEEAIAFLSILLKKHYGKKVIILIDEYDTPLNHAYNSGDQTYYKGALQFMSNLLSATIKTNNALEKACLTGVTWISENSMLSGLGITDYGLMDSQYQDCFGFTDKDLELIIKQCGVPAGMTLTPDQFLQAVKQWYNGYQIGNTVVCNPWSVLSCLSKGKFGPYWVDSGENSLARRIISLTSVSIQQQIKSLIEEKSIQVAIDKHVTYNKLVTTETSIWSLMLCLGYVKMLPPSSEAKADKDTEGDAKMSVAGSDILYRVAIPNREIGEFYKQCVINWFFGDYSKGQSFIEHLVRGNVDKFSEQLGTYLAGTVSLRNIGGEAKAELFYHGFCVAMVALLSDRYHVKSDYEAGVGYADVILIPKNSGNPRAIIFEFKHAKEREDEEKIAEGALEQIDQTLYQKAIIGFDHVKEVLKIGLAFKDKMVAVVYQTDQVTKSGETLERTSSNDPYIRLSPLRGDSEDDDEDASKADEKAGKGKRKRDEMESAASAKKGGVSDSKDAKKGGTETAEPAAKKQRHEKAAPASTPAFSSALAASAVAGTSSGSSSSSSNSSTRSNAPTHQKS